MALDRMELARRLSWHFSLTWMVVGYYSIALAGTLFVALCFSSTFSIDTHIAIKVYSQR